MSRWIWLAALAACGQSGKDPAGQSPSEEAPEEAAPSGEDAAPDEDSGEPEDSGEAPPPPADYAPPGTCDADDAAWVERAMALAMRRRPKGTEEVRVWTAAVEQHGREAALDAMMRSEDYVAGWSDWLIDAMQVNRAGYKESSSCFGEAMLETHDGSLTAHILNNDPSVDFGEFFTWLDVVRDALVADDLSSAYRAWTMVRMSHPQFICVALSDEDNEAIIREDFGRAFFRSFFNRDVTCLPCHNSEYSVTDGSGEADRFWPLEGHFEAAILGESAGPTLPEDAYRIFRYFDLVDYPRDTSLPWGWNPQCGDFGDLSDIDEDLIGEGEGFFVESYDYSASAWDIEGYLGEGLAAISGGGPAVGDDLSVDGRESLAYLLAANVVDQVWKEGIGARLTIAHGFPRNEHQHARLKALTETFIAEGYSLRTVLREVAMDPYFNLAAPAACAYDAYGLDPVVDPWSVENERPAERGNGPGELIYRQDARVLVRSLYDAMGWPHPSTFYSRYDNNPADGGGSAYAGDFFGAIGAWVEDSSPGFDGSDFQMLLQWESYTEGCTNYTQETLEPEEVHDFIDELLVVAGEQEATVSDAVIALKDRLTAQTYFPAKERALVSAVMGVSLSTPVAEVDPGELEAGLRALCDTLIISPQFQLVGHFDPSGEPPSLSVFAEDHCAAAAALLAEEGLELSCEEGS